MNTLKDFFHKLLTPRLPVRNQHPVTLTDAPIYSYTPILNYPGVPQNLPGLQTTNPNVPVLVQSNL